MSDLLERAAQALITRPPVGGPDPAQLRHRLGRRRRQRRSRMVIAAACLLTVGGLAAVEARHPGTPADRPAAATTAPPTAPQSAAVVPKVACDDGGCHGFDDLAVAAGASDFYVGPDTLGEPAVDRSLFDNLTRCAALSADFTHCDKLEGIALVPVVTYRSAAVTTVDTTVRGESSFRINIGTTFAELTPDQYATDSADRTDQGALDLVDTVVRGHDAARYLYGSSPTVVWQERPGVLVWVSVPPEAADQLIPVAEGVRRVDGPRTIPSRVVVPGTGHPYDAGSNDGDGLVVAHLGDLECVGYGYVNSCGQDIGDRTFIDLTEPQHVAVSGSAPANVTAVRFSTPQGDTATVATTAFAPYTSRFFDTTLNSDTPAVPTIIEWLDATDAVVQRSERPAPADPAATTATVPGRQPWGATDQAPTPGTAARTPTTVDTSINGPDSSNNVPPGLARQEPSSPSP